MRTIIFVYLSFFILGELFSQTNSAGKKHIYEADFDTINKIDVIPENILSDKSNILILLEPLEEKFCEKRAIEIRWPDVMSEGSHRFIITPKQIYLRTGHENPNWDLLYWVTNITQAQFKLIKKYVHSLINREFISVNSNYSYYQSLKYKNYLKEIELPEEWTDEEILKHDFDSQDKRYKNFARLMKIVNKPLGSNAIEIPDSNSFYSIKPIRIVYSTNEI